MGACNPLGGAPNVELYTEELVVFHQRLCEILQGGHPDLSPAERRWLMLFDEVARTFHQVHVDESYTLSFEALCKCVQKGKADNNKYVLLACQRKHLDHIKYRRRTSPLTDDHPDAGDHEAGVDARLDLEDALVKLRRADPRGEAAIRMQLDYHTYPDIAAKLNVSERHAIRLTQAARLRLRELLTDYGVDHDDD